MNNKVIAFLEIRFGRFLCTLLTIFDKFVKLFTSEGSIKHRSQKIVFIKFIEQGALVLHLNTFREAVRLYGRENIYIVTFGSNEPLIPLLNVFEPRNCIYLSEKSILSFSFSFFRALKKIRTDKIDSLIDLEFFSCATAIFSYMAGAVKRVGYHRYEGGQNYRGDLYTHRLSYSHYLSVGDTSWSMLESLSDTDCDFPSLPPMMPSSLDRQLFSPAPADIGYLSHLFPGGTLPEKMLIVNPSFQDVLPLRAWPVSYYRDYVQSILAQFKDHTIVFTGKANEYEDTQHFIKSFADIKAVNLCGKTTLRGLFTLYTRSELLLTSDSGPGHFASLTEIPTIVLFGPETPVLYAPVSPNIQVIYKSLPCSPCYNVYNNRMSACTNNRCLKAISVEEVAELSMKILRR